MRGPGRAGAVLGVALGLAGLGSCARARTPATSPARDASISPPIPAEGTARVLLARQLPGLDGRHLVISLVEVQYGPGQASPPHSHPCPVMGYVLAGAVRMGMRGGTSAVYRAGETFYESPDGVHEVSANASATAPARFLATFVCDHEGPRSVPAPPGQAGRTR